MNSRISIKWWQFLKPYYIWKHFLVNEEDNWITNQNNLKNKQIYIKFANSNKNLIINIEDKLENKFSNLKFIFENIKDKGTLITENKKFLEEVGTTNADIYNKYILEYYLNSSEDIGINNILLNNYALKIPTTTIEKEPEEVREYIYRDKIVTEGETFNKLISINKLSFLFKLKDLYKPLFIYKIKKTLKIPIEKIIVIKNKIIILRNFSKKIKSRAELYKNLNFAFKFNFNNNKFIETPNYLYKINFEKYISLTRVTRLYNDRPLFSNKSNLVSLITTFDLLYTIISILLNKATKFLYLNKFVLIFFSSLLYISFRFIYFIYETKELILDYIFNILFVEKTYFYCVYLINLLLKKILKIMNTLIFFVNKLKKIILAFSIEIYHKVYKIKFNQSKLYLITPIFLFLAYYDIMYLNLLWQENYNSAFFSFYLVLILLCFFIISSKNTRKDVYYNIGFITIVALTVIRIKRKLRYGLYYRLRIRDFVIFTKHRKKRRVRLRRRGVFQEYIAGPNWRQEKPLIVNSVNTKKKSFGNGILDTIEAVKFDINLAFASILIISILAFSITRQALKEKSLLESHGYSYITSSSEESNHFKNINFELFFTNERYIGKEDFDEGIMVIETFKDWLEENWTPALLKDSGTVSRETKDEYGSWDTEDEIHNETLQEAEFYGAIRDWKNKRKIFKYRRKVNLEAAHVYTFLDDDPHPNASFHFHRLPYLEWSLQFENFLDKLEDEYDSYALFIHSNFANDKRKKITLKKEKSFFKYRLWFNDWLIYSDNYLNDITSLDTYKSLKYTNENYTNNQLIDESQFFSFFKDLFINKSRNKPTNITKYYIKSKRITYKINFLAWLDNKLKKLAYKSKKKYNNVFSNYDNFSSIKQYKANGLTPLFLAKQHNFNTSLETVSKSMNRLNLYYMETANINDEEWGFLMGELEGFTKAKTILNSTKLKFKKTRIISEHQADDFINTDININDFKFANYELKISYINKFKERYNIIKLLNREIV